MWQEGWTRTGESPISLVVFSLSPRPLQADKGGPAALSILSHGLLEAFPAPLDHAAQHVPKAASRWFPMLRTGLDHPFTNSSSKCSVESELGTELLWRKIKLN